MNLRSKGEVLQPIPFRMSYIEFRVGQSAELLSEYLDLNPRLEPLRPMCGGSVPDLHFLVATQS